MGLLISIHEIPQHPGECGYFVAGNIVGGPKTNPIYSRPWGLLQADELVAVDLTYRLEKIPDPNNGVVYWMTLVGGLRQAINETPGLREALRKALEAT